MSKLNISEEELVRLRKLYKRRNELRAEFKIDFFVPNNGGQKAFFENADKKRRDIFGGNRWGKSTCGVIEDISWVLGERRFYPADNPLRRLGIPRRGVKGLVIAQTWDKVDELFTGEGFGSSPKGKIREYCPARCITNTWRDNQGRTTRMAFRSVIDGVQRDSLLYFATVQSFLRNEMGLESSDWDFIHVDEPLPRDMQVAVARGLVDRDGSMWRLLTPIEEMWMWDEAVMQSTAHPDYYWMYTGKAGENAHLKGMDAFYETLSEEELACRRDGRPMAAGRLVIHGYSESKHLSRGTPAGWKSIDEPPEDALIAVAIDTHPQTPHATLAVAITPTDAIIFDERFAKGSIEEIANWLKGKSWYDQIGYILIEPAAFIVDQTTKRSFADDFEKYGIELTKGSKARTEAIKSTNEHFYNNKPHLWVHERCTETRKELASWYFDRDNKPKDKDDHMMENLGRIILHDGLDYYPPPVLAKQNIPKHSTFTNTFKSNDSEFFKTSSFDGLNWET